MTNLNDVLDGLRSTKVKERAEGLKGITNAFSRERAIANFHINRNGDLNLKVWCTVFDALFRCYALERDAVMKKLISKARHAVDREPVDPSTSPGVKNFQETVRVIRWLIERTVEVNVKAADNILNHLLGSICCAGILFPIVAPQYAKALRCMLEHRPLLQHVKLEHWTRMVRVGSNIVLGRPVNAVQDDALSPVGAEIDSDMYAHDSPGDEEDSTAALNKGRKRTPTAAISPIKPRKRSRRSPILSVSVEQIEFVSILRLLISSSTAPIIHSDKEYAAIPTRILSFLEQFLEKYPSDSSLLQDYIQILASTLNQLSLNRKDDIERFARSNWSGLIGLWATKDKRLKEGLLVVLRHLFPFFVCPVDLEHLTPFAGCLEGVSRLWRLLNGEAENRWGVDGLSLETLRLEIKGKSPSAIRESAFVANTFRAGWGFDAGQALSWAMLELQADCASQLFQLSEQVQPTPVPESTLTQSKRLKLENPVTTLLHAIQASSAPHVRALHLQTLLFFIDRHWDLVHDSLKQDIVNGLLQLVGYDDAAIQSWVFLNFAAISYAEGMTEQLYAQDALTALDHSIWDSIWAHAIRRSNVPGICRAACHTGYALLFSSRSHSKDSNVLVTFHKVLLEIEALFKDMDVQGPTYPFDSVCIFLSHCLGIASQDVRLYRMHLEDKVLAWFVDNWKIGGNRMKMDPCTINDVLLLLQTTCNLTKQVNIAVDIPLPSSSIVDSIKEENKVRIIRDFLLYAKLPPSRSSIGCDKPHTGTIKPLVTTSPSQLVAPRARERKISSFLQRTLDSLLGEWEYLKDNHPTAETARRSLDVAVIALAFESLLIFNGTSANRQLLQTAAKIILLLTPFLKDSRWTPSEKMLVAQGFEILVPPAEYSPKNIFSEALTQPGSLSGIKERTLQALAVDDVAGEQVKANRTAWLRLMWQNADIQAAMTPIATVLRSLLGRILGETTSHLSSEPTDMEDDFGPIRTANPQNSAGARKGDREQSIKHLMQICINFLTSGPFLQSSSGEPARDRELVATVLRSGQDADKFLTVCPIFLHHVRLGTIGLPFKDLNEIMDIFGSLMGQYRYSRNQEFLQILLDVVQSTLGIWQHNDPTAQDVHFKFQNLCHHFARCLRTGNIPSWRLRDSVAIFLGSYLSVDPSRAFWGEPIEPKKKYEEENEEPPARLPEELLRLLNNDPDMRVRFRVAAVNASLFSITRQLERTPVELNTWLKKSYSVDADQWEHMLSRMLAVGSIMVVSSEVRRGVYWNLLEACNTKFLYSGHTGVILEAIAETLGMPNLSSLFEEYAAQLAYAFATNSTSPLLALPPRLLGYQNRKQAALATLRLLTPTNIMEENGAPHFEMHRNILHISVPDALRECFDEIVARCITTSICFGDDIGSMLNEKLSLLPDFSNLLEERIDGIVASLLRCHGDQDISDGGPIMSALRSIDTTGEIVLAFRSLTVYRAADNFVPHAPNLPNISTSVVLHGLIWLQNRYPHGFTKATTYNVLHQLLHALQKTLLVNEQFRLLNAVSLWIAYRHEDFLDPAMLYTLTHGSTLLLSQSDLARSAQSFLTWSLRYYRKGSVKDTRLSNILLRIGCIAHGYSSNTTSASVSQLGKQLRQWIDGRLLDLTTSLRDTVSQALAAWPYTPESNLSSLYDQVTGFDIRKALEDHRTTSNKFRLVRSLKEYTVVSQEAGYHNTDFWQLKACIPPPDAVQDEDVHAFVKFLSSSCGQIGTFPVDSPVAASSCSRQRFMTRPRRDPPANVDPIFAGKNAIVHTLFTILEGQEPTQVSSAYNTLRLISGVLSVEEHQAKLPIEYSWELELLRVHCPRPVTLPATDLSELMKSDEHLESVTDFPRWIRLFSLSVVGALANVDPFYVQLSPFVQSDVPFAEDILPVLVHALLQFEVTNKTKDFQPRVLLSNYFSYILTSITVDMCCLRVIVDIVLHLRSFNPRPNDALAYNEWLKVDFRLLAQGARVCGAYTTALLFLELADEYKNDKAEAESSAEQVLYDIYSHIDEPDGFYGISTNDLHQFLIKRFHHEKQWEKAFRFHGAALEADRSRGAEQEGLLESFHYFGFDHLAIDTLRNSSSSDRYPSSMSYKLGWRTETWDLPDQTSNDARSAALYRSLRAVYRERDPVLLQAVIRTALREELDHLRSLGNEDLAEIRSISQDLMCLGEVLQWQQDIQTRLKPESMDLNAWHDFFNINPKFDFFVLESIMATRISLIRSIRQREERQQLGSLTTPFLRDLIDVEKRCLLRLSEAARLSGQVQVALNSVVRAQRLCNEHSWDVSEEFASVLWLQKEERPAVQFLQDILRRTPADENSLQLSRRALVLSRLGTWTAEACLEKPTEIWEHYFSSSIDLLDGQGDGSESLVSTKAAVYRACAMFAERQYHATLESPDAMRRKIYVDRKKQEIADRQSLLESQRDAAKYKVLQTEQDRAQKLFNEDSELFRKHNMLLETFLKQAVEMHSRYLETSGEHDDDSAIRFCSLWFANFEDQFLLDTIQSALGRIPSIKLVFLAHQLTARLSNPPTAELPRTQQNLQNLVTRMCFEHPFHSLYQLYCLADQSGPDSNQRQSGRHTQSQSTQTERGTAANTIFDRLESDQASTSRVRDIKILCDACLEWAKLPIAKKEVFKRKQKGGYPIPPLKITGLSKLNVPVTTAHTPLDPTLRYNDFVSITGYLKKFFTAGGVNVPKICVCMGSDGKGYKQLFKGEGSDDLRQDAVMEQVFDLVNNVLRRDRETRRRSLRVRGYMVVPLASQAGLLEYVGNTFTFREWLQKAHITYRPHDLKPAEFQCRLKKVQDEYKHQPEKQLAVFLECRKRFKPVMRHYFTEQHKTPTAWFQHRLNYTRSVATTSIVGHVLGLGDRHVSNILLDSSTGEVVHIDLGIAFDQGKLLPVPERVPFRMTADIVDGMGTSGTAGVFQRCAEETLRVLRNESGVIMTVLEVFKHDPLHQWTASEIKVKQAQSDVPPTPNDTTRFNQGIGLDMTSGSADEAADRALTSVARKLDKALSVESTVNELLAQATDPMNLATIFNGWSPHL
ncbi:hypothetical protein NLJ89_g3702 [Agrocybe chaxingu]|uniref:Serine/threonine-protein kinase Tel1 n=1 Tax=Agrocybe chaxingu TaxID=84603 RepID=A0A9W8K444_9AGAR|nr:hypothetical protein NLJ89_g3702 [Agrocybe chaxingu]